MTKTDIMDILKKDFNVSSSRLYVNEDCNYIIAIENNTNVFIYKINNDSLVRKFSTRLYSSIITNLVENERYICFGTGFTFVLFDKLFDIGKLTGATVLALKCMNTTINTLMKLNITQNDLSKIRYSDLKDTFICVENKTIRLIKDDLSKARRFTFDKEIIIVKKIEEGIYFTNDNVLTLNDYSLIDLDVALCLKLI